MGGTSYRQFMNTARQPRTEKPTLQIPPSASAPLAVLMETIAALGGTVRISQDEIAVSAPEDMDERVQVALAKFEASR
jgi:hypothetical protein